MASENWNGGTGSYLDPTQWTPAGVPLYGLDTIATINAGTVSLNNAAPNGITLDLAGPTAFTEPGPRLVVNNAAFGAQMTFNMTHRALLTLQGYDTNYGTISLSSPGAILQGEGYGQLYQVGRMTVGSSATANFGLNTVLYNIGFIELAGGNLSAAGPIGGEGTIELASPDSVMRVFAGVDPRQIFIMQQGELAIANYNSFQGTIADFTSNAAVVTLSNLPFDAAIYVQDGTGEHLMLTSNGATVGELKLSGTAPTRYTVTTTGTLTSIRPDQVYTDGSIPASITTGSVTIQNAEPNGRAVALGGPSILGAGSSPNLLLNNGALGPQFLLTVASPTTTGPQTGVLTVQGYDTNYGEIDVIPSADALVTGLGNTLTIDITQWSQLNQEGTIKITSPQVGSPSSSNLYFSGPGTLNNDGQILIEPGSFAGMANTHVVGYGTITVDHSSLALSNVAGTQTINFLAGSITAAPANFNATIENWNNGGSLILPSDISSVQFNQTSAAAGDLLLFNGIAQAGALHLLGTYATADFTRTQSTQAVDIGLTGHAPPSV